MPSVPWRVEFSKIFKFFFSKFQKCPKSFPKESKRDLIVIWDNFFEKFLPSFPWKVESSKIFKKLKKVSNFLKRPKSFPKVSKLVLNKFWGKLFEIFFAQCSVECRVFENFRKNIFKIPKLPKSVPKSIQTCYRVIFLKKILCPVFHGGSSFRKFSNFFFSKFQKCPKVFPKVSKHDLNMFWGKLFEKFLPSFPWNVESSKIFKIFFSKFQKCPKVFPKVSKRVLG